MLIQLEVLEITRKQRALVTETKKKHCSKYITHEGTKQFRHLDHMSMLYTKHQNAGGFRIAFAMVTQSHLNFPVAFDNKVL